MHKPQAGLARSGSVLVSPPAAAEAGPGSLSPRALWCGACSCPARLCWYAQEMHTQDPCLWQLPRETERETGRAAFHQSDFQLGLHIHGRPQSGRGLQGSGESLGERKLYHLESTASLQEILPAIEVSWPLEGSEKVGTPAIAAPCSPRPPPAARHHFRGTFSTPSTQLSFPKPSQRGILVGPLCSWVSQVRIQLIVVQKTAFLIHS